MKLKIFTLGLLAALAMTSTSVEAMQAQQRRAAEQNSAVQAEKAEAKAAAAKLDIGVGGAHAGDAVAAAQDIYDRIGAHTAPGAGDTTNERLTDLRNTLGIHPVGGVANNHANKRAEDIAARLGTRAVGGPTGPSIHEKLTDLHALLGHKAVGGAANNPAILKVEHALGTLGNVTFGAIDDGVGIPYVPANAPAGHGAGEVMPNVNTRLERALARLKVGIAANTAAGHRVRTVASTDKGGTNTAAANDTDANNEGAAAAATNIEEFLNALGW